MCGQRFIQAVAPLSLALIAALPLQIFSAAARGPIFDESRGVLVAAGSPTGFWRMSRHVSVQEALRNHEFASLSLPRLYVAR
jgi:hypothetical protein